MSIENFVHLHVHTEFSLLDGAARITDLIQQTKALGMNAIAITDHGNLYGAINFYKTAVKHGIKPILGCEVYVAPRARTLRAEVGGIKYFHLILLAENNRGWRNLVKLISRANTEGFYYKPRVDKELLREYHDGLIALSACVAGEIPRAILDGALDDHVDVLVREYVEIFGRENFFLELQNHGMPEEARVDGALLELAHRYELGLVVTNDVHYVQREDAEFQDIMLCIQTNSTVNAPSRLRFNSDEYYLKSPDEMRKLFPDHPEAVENTIAIAERCNVEFEFNRMMLPHYQLPPPYSFAADYLRDLCVARLPERYAVVNDEVRERLEHELSTIRKMGYDNYFLIVWDFIRYAKNRGIAVGPGRGSAAGSLVAYLLGITDLDPIKLGLLFERFLNPERVTMPDIDVDFCYLRREEVIEYVKRKYGRDHVGQIITFGTMAAKAVVRDVGRVLEFSVRETTRIVRMMPNEIKFTLEQALETSKELRTAYEKEPHVKQLIDLSRRLEGLPRHSSVHAAGLVIAPEPLDELVPVQQTGDTLITQFDKDTLEELGLLKMDFLGLRTLTALNEALENINHRYATPTPPSERSLARPTAQPSEPSSIDQSTDQPSGVGNQRCREAPRGAAQQLSLFESPLTTFESIPLEDEITARMLADGRTGAIFQLESVGITKLVRDLRPQCFNDLISIVALYRPGPLGSGMVQDFIDRKNGKVTVEYLHPSLEPILRETYGVILYQEQVMEIVRELAGFTLGHADLLRRAMSKKKSDILLAQRAAFVEGCSARNIDRSLAEKIFELMLHFADYGFNKSHSAAYALLTWRMAYLKANYPAEYMAAMLSSVMDIDKTTVYTDLVRRMGLAMLGPDVNRSARNFRVVDSKTIRFGLAALWNVSEAVVDNIIETRERSGDFKSLSDFCRRIDLRLVNRRAIEVFVKSGAFDSLDRRRTALLRMIDDACSSAERYREELNSGQSGLFSDRNYITDLPVPTVEEEPRATILAWEKESLGFYLSGNPLEQYHDRIGGLRSFREIINGDSPDKKTFRLAGLIIGLRRSITQNGDTMGFLKLEDFTERIEVTVFPKVYQRTNKLLTLDSVVVVDAGLEQYRDATTFVAKNIVSAAEYEPDFHLTVPDDNYNQLLEEIRTICSKHRGTCSVYIVHDCGAQLKRYLLSGYQVKYSRQLREALENLLGKDNVERH